MQAPAPATEPTNTSLVPPDPVAELRYPPFASPEVVSFDEFEPSGILLPSVPDSAAISKDAIGQDEDEDEDETDVDADVEVDGKGVATVQLSTRHEPFSLEPGKDQSGMWRGKEKADRAIVAANKRRKAKKHREELKALGMEAEKASGKRHTWWEKWELEDMKKQSHNDYPTGEDRVCRIDLATKAFKKGHSMESGVQSIWDRFLDYIGVLRQETQLGGWGKQKVSRGIQRRPAEDEFSDDDEEMPEPKNMEDVWDERCARFLDRTIDTLKRFFSSRYHYAGLCWSEAKLRDGPIIVSLYIRYLLKDRVVPECTDNLTRALAFLEETIKPDLLATRAFSQGAEDNFSIACCNDLGNMVLLDGYGRWMPAKGVLEERDKRDKRIRDEAEQYRREKEAEWKRRQALIAAGVQEEARPWGADWNNNPEPVWWDGPNLWEGSTVVVDTNGEPPASSWPPADKPTLAPFSTALTHSLLRTEHSVRRIVSVRPPDPASSDVLRQKYATVVFDPWTLPANVKDDDLLGPPEMLCEATGETELRVMRMPGGQHALKDRIELLVEPEHAETARKGLGVYAIWVQAAKTAELPGSAAAIEPPIQTFWFFQHVTMVVPSFWVEE
ncbi:hypothetical protein DACRYDRAFT_113751 [Dacryopinax primogenitus]|uniref:Uncharacterized protein n=1 Tax=Dacryopinax primogenitus (strain DJM 731) TaxID=1858805 RepID=M5GBE3_DACPD|nr:uncharacterized protein DACRYDRAFT_113751 [Dacryopinax primogenitus]EJU05695.1 hypothetical protein DACRYDRAFT_113751 [Dacryopinax primogenitus]